MFKHVRSLHGENFIEHIQDEYKTRKAFYNLQPKASDLRSLSLRMQCKLSGKQLFSLVGTAKALEIFEYPVGHGR